jgi:hypothetical protein
MLLRRCLTPNFDGRDKGFPSPSTGAATQMSRRQKGLRPFLESWQNVAARIIQRVQRVAAANLPDERKNGFLEKLLGAGRYAVARPGIATEIALKLRERVTLGAQQRHRLGGVGLSNFREAEPIGRQPALFE